MNQQRSKSDKCTLKAYIANGSSACEIGASIGQDHVTSVAQWLLSARQQGPTSFILALFSPSGESVDTKYISKVTVINLIKAWGAETKPIQVVDHHSRCLKLTTRLELVG